MMEEDERRRAVRDRQKQVAVIGAGVSGVAAAKCLIDQGFEPVVFEQGAELGGIWRYDEALPDGGGPAYRGLRTNTSRQTTAFSDFPFPATLPDFPPRAAVARYLDDYADRFCVRERVRFRTKVAGLTPAGDGRWAVESCSADGSSVETFDAAVVCSGVFRDPLLPAVPGAESFTGAIMHSRAYTVPDRFAGQTVLVVGAGSSATDVAIEAGAVAEQVYMSVRGTLAPSPGPPVPTRAGTLAAWLNRRLPPRAQTRIRRHAALAWSRHFFRRPGTPDAPFVLGSMPYTPNEKLREPLASGAVTLKPAIARLDGDSVVFTDGSRVRVDTIVFATGYRLSFPFLPTSIFQPSSRGLGLYRLVLPPEWPTLAFVGMFRVSGPAPPVAEMQARWAAHVFRGAVPLPSPDEMRRAIAIRHQVIARTGGNPFRLDAEAYQDMLAAEIGALPRLWRHPLLWWPILAGPHVAAQYRLDGPGRWRGAVRAIRDAQTAPPGAAGGSPAPAVRTEQA